MNRLMDIDFSSHHQFNYDYVTTIMGLGVFNGYVEGAAENIVIKCDFLIDMYDFYIFMQVSGCYNGSFV